MSGVTRQIGKIVFECEADSGVEYRPHPEFPNYAIGDDGSVWTVMCGIIQKLSPSLRGPGKYHAVTLHYNGRKAQRYVHQLVLETYDTYRPDNLQCRHLDGNNQNNRVENLKWGTAWEQAQDKILHGTVNKGSRNGQSKLTEESVREIKSLLNSGSTTEQLADKFGVSGATINRVASNAIWSHVDLPPCEARSRYCRGDSSPNSKLSEQQVLEILERLKAGERYLDIAAVYGISGGLVGHIAKGRAWSHVTGIEYAK